MKAGETTISRGTTTSSRVRRTSAERASVLFGGKKLDTMIYARELLPAGKKYSGPAVVTEYSATTVIPEGKRFGLDRFGNLLIEVR